MTYFRNVHDWFANVFYTFGVAFITWTVLAFAVWAAWHYPAVPSWYFPFLPITYYSVIWIVSLLLPLTSTLYLVFDLRLRRYQIEDAAERNQLHLVYFPDNSPVVLNDFSRLLRRRFRETCQPLELVFFSTIAGVIAFVFINFVFYNTFNTTSYATGYYTIKEASRIPILAALAGSLAGAYVYVFNKFRTFDIYPSTYLQACIGFIAGSLGGVFIGTIYDCKILGFVAFAIGFLTAINVTILSSLLRHELARLTGVNLPEETKGDLNEIIQNAGAIESLHNMAIYSVGELVEVDPITIYLGLPAPIGVINGWLDEGLILYYFGCQNKNILAAAGIRRFTQLLELTIEQWAPPREGIDKIKWKARIEPLAGLEIELIVRDEVRCVVGTQIHNRLLGVLSERYRKSVFLSRPLPAETLSMIGADVKRSVQGEPEFTPLPSPATA